MFPIPLPSAEVFVSADFVTGEPAGRDVPGRGVPHCGIGAPADCHLGGHLLTLRRHHGLGTGVSGFSGFGPAIYTTVSTGVPLPVFGSYRPAGHGVDMARDQAGRRDGPRSTGRFRSFSGNLSGLTVA
jgi:hypothetical protein